MSHGVVISPDIRYAIISVEGVGNQPGTVDIIDLQSLKMATHADIGKQAGGIACCVRRQSIVSYLGLKLRNTFRVPKV